VRRAIVVDRLSTPKSGKGGTIALPASLVEQLSGLLATRRRECLQHGLAAVPEWVFCTRDGKPLQARNFERTWYRLRRRAQGAGVRPFRLHATRHSYATHALRAGKSVAWVAAQLGHANPETTLRVYSHALREEEPDLSFADFSTSRMHPGASEPETVPKANREAARKVAGIKDNPWSGRRGSNPRPSAWEADALPLSYSRACTGGYQRGWREAAGA